MDFFDGYYDMHKSFNYELVKSISTTTPNSSPLRKSKIYFIFSFNFEVSKWILGEDDGDESELVCRSTNPEIDFAVSVGSDRFSSTEETRSYMQEKLSVMPIDPDDRRNLVDFAMYEASKHNTECCSSLSLHFNVLLEHEYIFLDEEVHDDHEDEELRDDYESTFIRMVPAKDSSIQVLKKVEAAGYSRRNMDCSICLEKLFDGDCYREALSMPCSHVFHGDCIKNWLRVSHYCPLCRFEMPTN